MRQEFRVYVVERTHTTLASTACLFSSTHDCRAKPRRTQSLFHANKRASGPSACTFFSTSSLSASSCATSGFTMDTVMAGTQTGPKKESKGHNAGMGTLHGNTNCAHQMGTVPQSPGRGRNHLKPLMGAFGCCGRGYKSTVP
jgi:hypothetical protein